MSSTDDQGRETVASPDTHLQTRDLTRFQRRLSLLASSVIILVGMVYLLREFATVFQHLFVALFLSYMIMPVYQWLARRGVPILLAVILIIAGVVAAFAGLGVLVGNSFNDLATKLPHYQDSLSEMIEKAAQRFPKLARSIGESAGAELATGVQLVRSALLGLSDFLSQAFLVIIYLLFILA